MKIALIFTNDWELFGDGSGDYFEIQHKPLQQMAGIAANYGAKISVMAEVAQQQAHLDFSAKFPGLGNIAQSWEEILRETVKKGHDVQLHLHPQWFEAKYEAGGWKLDMSKWAIGGLPFDEINGKIKSAKEYLEGLLKPANNLYECFAFRAGAYYIQPEKNVIKALKANSFLCDTSVTKGLKTEGIFDFSGAFSNIIPWISKEDNITEQGGQDEGILEIPIYSFAKYESKILRKFAPNAHYSFTFGESAPQDELDWASGRDRIKAERYPPGRRLYKQNTKRGLNFYRKAALEKASIQLDYDYLPATIFVSALKNLVKDEYAREFYDRGIILPVVASGHTKDMHTPYNFEKILKLINLHLKDNVEFWTLSQAVEYWLNLSAEKNEAEK